MKQAISPRQFRLTGWHVLAGFAAFFGVVAAVDARMMMDAYRSFPGEVATNPYEDGLAFDGELAQQRAQRALGWRMTAGLSAPGVISVAVKDRTGAPVSALRFDARLERPATEQGRRGLTFAEVAPGIYRAGAAGLAGAWDLRLSAYDRHGRRFDAERRLVSP